MRGASLRDILHSPILALLTRAAIRNSLKLSVYPKTHSLLKSFSSLCAFNFLPGKRRTVKESILTISRDRHLQRTRTVLLEAHGYHVSAATDDAQALAFVEAPNTFCLVLLCHTVPEKSRLILVPRIRELRPGLPILMLYDGYEPTNAKVDGSLQNLSGPKAVLDMVGFLMQQVGES